MRHRKGRTRGPDLRPRRPGTGGPLGSRNGNAKLTSDMVIEIRRSWDNRKDPAMRWLKVTQASLAEQYGVSIPTIHGIVNRQTWRWL